MNWDLFLKNLGVLNQSLSASSEKKEEVYNILVEHNKKAEIDFINRLNTRKINKLIKNMATLSEKQKISVKPYHTNVNKDSFNITLSDSSESNHVTKYKQNLTYSKLKNKVAAEVGTPNIGVSTSFLYNLHI